MPAYAWKIDNLTKARKRELKAVAVLAVIRDHVPELFTRFDLYEAWDNYGIEQLRMSRNMIDAQLRALMKDELVVQYIQTPSYRKLYYLRTVSEIEKNNQRKLIAQHTIT